MANQGFPYEGSDHRLLGGIFARICSALSWASHKHPPYFIIDGIGFRFYWPKWWTPNVPPSADQPFPFRHKFLMFRAGWHYDSNNQAYILGGTIKVTPDVTL